MVYTLFKSKFVSSPLRFSTVQWYFRYTDYLKYSYRFEIVISRFKNVTADLGNGSRFEIIFFRFKCICRFVKNVDVFIMRMECAMTHSHNVAKRQHGTRLKSTKTVSLFGKIYNLNAGLWKKLPTKAEVGLFSKFLLETVFLN